MEQENNQSKWKVLSGLFWRFGERFAAQGVSFVVSLALARLLLPEYYGIVSVVKIFLVVFKAVVQDGLGYALIQKKDADRVDFSTVFYAQLMLGTGLYALVFCMAPILAGWYREPLLIPVFRVMALSLPIGAVNCVQQAFVSRNMQFKRFFFSTIIGTILSAGIGLGMAAGGLGVWALAAQDLSNLICDTLILWFTVKWRPSFCFSLSRLREMFRYSWKLLVTTLIDNLYNSAYPMLIGAFFGTVQQGYYDRGDIIPNVISSNITTAFKSVLLSAYAKEQEKREALKAMLRRSLRLAAFVFFPLMAGLIGAAEPLTLLLLGEKWRDSIPFLQFCSLFFAFVPIQVICQQGVSATGRSDIALKLEIGKKLLGLLLLLFGLPFGIAGLMAGKALSSFAALLLGAVPNRNLFSYRFSEQAADLFPPLLLSGAMGFVVWCFTLFSLSPLLTLLLQVTGGVLFYAGGAALFRMESFSYLLQEAGRLLHRKKS